MRTAVILFNLGGPGSLEEVEPFLFNLFSDRAIIDLPSLIRIPLAKLISKRRAPIARRIYAELGGSSPILDETRKQQLALQSVLGDDLQGEEVGVFIAMRYSSPRAITTARVVKSFSPDRIILLPLYPQFSTTTTASSIAEWRKIAGGIGLDVPTRTICCYPDNEKFIDAHAVNISNFLKGVPKGKKQRFLFSAHGLPQKIVDKGDPYAGQVKKSVTAVVDRLNSAYGIETDDYVVCFQSRVGPLKWLQPSTDDEIRRAGVNGVSVVVVPIAFVSEHSETLVELDIEYAKLAAESGVASYIRVPALGDHPLFIEGLADIVRAQTARLGQGSDGDDGDDGCDCSDDSDKKSRNCLDGSQCGHRSV